MNPDQDSRFEHLKPGLDALPPVERSVEDGTLRETRAFRGVTLEQAMRYLENLGGERTGETEIEGDGCGPTSRSGTHLSDHPTG